MGKLYLSSLLINFLFLTGCPHQFVDMIEKNTINKKYPNILNTQQIKPGEKSIISLDQKIKFDSTNSPVFIEIQNINSNLFPAQIEITATVRDTNGNFISGLAAPYLKSGAKQSDFWLKLTDSCSKTNYLIDSFTVKEVRANDAPPFALTYVLDFSGSMGSKGKQAIGYAIPKMLKTSKKGDLVSIVSFTNKALVNVPIQESFSFLSKNDTVDFSFGLESSGTDIYLGLTTAFDVIKDAPETHQKIIILISDGQYFFSKQKLDSIIYKIRKHNTKIFTLTLGFGMSDIMTKLAEISGGKSYQVLNYNQFKYIFADIYLRLKNYYLISYKPPDCLNLHKANVYLNMDSLKQGIVSTHGFYDKTIFVEYDTVGTINLVNIEFETGKADISSKSFDLLDNIAIYMKKSKNVKLQITGHTDDVGNELDNLTLSQNRALAVMNYLIEKGVKDSRLKSFGMGETKPLFPNDNDLNRQKNRRTEFEIIGK